MGAGFLSERQKKGYIDIKGNIMSLYPVLMAVQYVIIHKLGILIKYLSKI